MIWLILQMLTCLALAVTLGLLLGWWLRGLGVAEARRRDAVEWDEQRADYKQRLEASQDRYQRAADRLAACEAGAVELSRRLAAAIAERDALAASGPAAPPRLLPAPPARPGSPERWVVRGAPDTETGES